MVTQKQTEANTTGDGRMEVVLELHLGEAAETFNLEKAVCSHGLFMMAPNHWDTISKTLQRPLRLSLDPFDKEHEVSVMVQISHPPESPHALRLRVFGTCPLSSSHQESIFGQVRRMLRLSEEENKNVREFQEVYEEAKARGFGRVFRSPTLFEDMVKCILLCNCQWSRTLSMARALCELQLEQQYTLASTTSSSGEVNTMENISSQKAESEHFVPKTPVPREFKRKHGDRRNSRNILEMSAKVKSVLERDVVSEAAFSEITECCHIERGEPGARFSCEKDLGFTQRPNGGQIVTEADTIVSCSSNTLSMGKELCFPHRIGNFPSARELASLSENFLAKRCNLGYRASRILNLARSIVDGDFQLRELEEACSRPGLADYDKLLEQLKGIDGFGPFTSANVLMCLGFYHVIPTDSETIRHLKQVHGRNSTVQTVQRDVELIYGSYSPFQFLVYWSEVWHFYEEWFGKLSEMPHDDYRLITAANMRHKNNGRNKRVKITQQSPHPRR